MTDEIIKQDIQDSIRSLQELYFWIQLNAGMFPPHITEEIIDTLLKMVSVLRAKE